MNLAAPVNSTQAYLSEAAPLVYVCGLAALASVFVQLLFLCFVSPTYLDVGPQTMSAVSIFGHCFLYGGLPVFLTCFCVGRWAMFVRRKREQQIDWPAWCIIGWALIGVGSIVAAVAIEAGVTGYKLSDMVFAPLPARITMQALLTFTLYSVTLLIAGYVFLSRLEHQLASVNRD